MRGKITEDHLRRKAYVYVRQSSLRQVRCHQESRDCSTSWRPKPKTSDGAKSR